MQNILDRNQSNESTESSAPFVEKVVACVTGDPVIGTD